jgi:saccharopine dehydrogenase-like NADP-dependent oxidoreductase
MNLVILGGAGKIAPASAAFLTRQNDIGQVVLADTNLEGAQSLANRLGKKAIAEFVDFNDHSSLVRIFKDADVVLNSTVYYSNLKVMEACLEAKTHYVDQGGLFHMAKKQAEKDKDFREAGLIALSGMGSAPGLVNIMARYGADRLDTIDHIRMRAGCVDLGESSAPLRAAYALDTIIDEFTIPSQVFEDGEWKEVPPLSGEEEITFPEPVGTMRCYYTLHTEVFQLPNSFREKQVREVNWKLGFPPDFMAKLKFLCDLGFDKEELEVAGGKVSPRALLRNLVSGFEKESSEADPSDHEAYRVNVKGREDGKEIEYCVEFLVHPDEKLKLGAETLCTGVPAGWAAWLIARGDIVERGVLPPERCIDPEDCFRMMAGWGMPVWWIRKEYF